MFSDLDILPCLENHIMYQRLSVLVSLVPWFFKSTKLTSKDRCPHEEGCILNGRHWGREHCDLPGAPFLIIETGDFFTLVGQHMIKHVPILRPNKEYWRTKDQDKYLEFLSSHLGKTSPMSHGTEWD